MKSFGEAVSLVTDSEDKSPHEGEPDRLRIGVVLLVQKVEEFRSTLEIMDHHETMAFLCEAMRQGSMVKMCARQIL